MIHLLNLAQILNSSFYVLIGKHHAIWVLFYGLDDLDILLEGVDNEA